jgi:putative PIN family toxin of toxin-antitoxin system
MKAVLDANVAVSAAINPAGTPGEILARWQHAAFTWVISAPLLDELADVFSRPGLRRFFTWRQQEIDDFFRNLLKGAEMVSPQTKITRITADPDDNRVLEAAVEAQADYIVSGDRHLLDLGDHDGIPIVTPADFLVILTLETQNP